MSADKMPRQWFLILLPFILFPSTFAQCSSDTCPPGGIWGEWTTTGSCATTCGACDSLTYTRTCLSTRLPSGCGCTGDPSVTKPCGTQACNYPRTNGTGQTCCNGTPIIINNWYHCGPLQSTNSLSCCPKGGYWSAWSTWNHVKDRIQWTRSRTCLSGKLNCPCDGSTTDTTYVCPCIPIKPMTIRPSCPEMVGKTLFAVRDPIFMPSPCVNRVVFESSNYRQEFHKWNGTFYTTTIRWVDMNGNCHSSEVPVGREGSSGATFKMDFVCNLETLRFGGNLKGVDMDNLEMIAQFY